MTNTVSWLKSTWPRVDLRHFLQMQAQLFSYSNWSLDYSTMADISSQVHCHIHCQSMMHTICGYSGILRVRIHCKPGLRGTESAQVNLHSCAFIDWPYFSLNTMSECGFIDNVPLLGPAAMQQRKHLIQEVLQVHVQKQTANL